MKGRSFLNPEFVSGIFGFGLNSKLFSEKSEIPMLPKLPVKSPTPASSIWEFLKIFKHVSYLSYPVVSYPSSMSIPVGNMIH